MSEGYNKTITITIIKITKFLVAGGCASRLSCGWYGNPGIGMSNIISKAVASGELALTESTNFSMVLRLHAGKLGVPASHGTPTVAGALLCDCMAFQAYPKFFNPPK